MKQEIWKDIAGYEGLYKVSSLGRFMSFRKDKWHIDYINNYFNIYKGKVLIKNGARKYFRAHRLIAETFLPNPENKSEVNHKDLNRGNNEVNNLEWVTHSENLQHSANNYPLTIMKNCYEILGYKPRKQLSFTDNIITSEKIFASQSEALSTPRAVNILLASIKTEMI